MQDLRAVRSALLMSPWAAVMFAAAVLVPLPAAAASLSFDFSLSGSKLTVRNRGSASAFYPAVFRMTSSGKWQRLGGDGGAAQFAPGAALILGWPEPRPESQSSAVASLQPVMLRFFDQAGVGFGQIAFLGSRPLAAWPLQARHQSGALLIDPPSARMSAVHTTWVLWAQEDGIGPIRFPVRFEHDPTPALRIDWHRRGAEPVRLYTGAGQPDVSLIHETVQGFALQSVPGGRLQGREQRAAWLDAAPIFYAAASITVVVALGAWLGQILRRRRSDAER